MAKKRKRGGEDGVNEKQAKKQDVQSLKRKRYEQKEDLEWDIQK